MAEYINRDAFLDQQRTWYCKDCNMRKNTEGKTVYEIGEAPCRACHINDLLDEVENCPASDVVERKTGKWLKVNGYAIALTSDDEQITMPTHKCSACGKPSLNVFYTNYCPYCGAQMIGGDEDV